MDLRNGMDGIENVLGSFVEGSREILGSNLVGIYLHGSAAMGCFHSQKSDLDLLVVIGEVMSNEAKRQYMDMAVKLNRLAPAKGIEFSIVREQVCRPFAYPTPFELHFSIAHLGWYEASPDEYVERMKGEDKDLAAHAAMALHRGETLYGKERKEVFSEVRREDYFDSIWADIENAEEEIEENGMYVTLNLCRVLAYREESRILSKQEGGEWGLSHLPEKYVGLIEDALMEYGGGSPMEPDRRHAKEYARYMLGRIQREPGP